MAEIEDFLDRDEGLIIGTLPGDADSLETSILVSAATDTLAGVTADALARLASVEDTVAQREAQRAVAGQERRMPGGMNSLADPDGTPESPTAKGVYAQYPAMSPRYHPGNDAASVAHQARLFIEFAGREEYEQYRELVPTSVHPYLDALATPQGGGGGVGYFDFLLTSSSEQRQEKAQVSEVLSDSHIAHFFGESAKVWSYQGVLLNSQQDPWYDAWIRLYSEVLRGTKLAMLRRPVHLYYDHKVVTGSIMSTATGMNSSNEILVPFSFSLLVSDISLQSPVRYSSQDIVDNAVTDRGAPARAAFAQIFTSLSAARDRDTDDAEALQTQLRPEDARPDFGEAVRERLAKLNERIGNTRAYKAVKQAIADLQARAEEEARDGGAAASEQTLVQAEVLINRLVAAIDNLSPEEKALSPLLTLRDVASMSFPLDSLEEDENGDQTNALIQRLDYPSYDPIAGYAIAPDL